MKKSSIKIILDTNIFVNPDSRSLFGHSPREALNNFLAKIKKRENVICYIPPSIYEELVSFVDEERLCQDISHIVKKPPAQYHTPISALLFYEFIDEVRARINKGLRIAEKYLRKAMKKAEDQELIKSLREEYRNALRDGIIDSKGDFDLILLSKELEGYLATTDLGLIKWAHKFGISCLSARELKNLLD